MNQGHLTPEERERLLALYADGVTVVQIAGELGRTERQIYRILSRLRPPPVSGGVRAGGRRRVITPERRAQMLQLRAQGMSGRQIGPLLGVSSSSVSRALAEPAAVQAD